MDDKLQKEENISQEVDNPVKSGSLQPPECVVCSTTSPESSFIFTSRTKLGTSLSVFVQKCIKPSWKPEDHPKCTTICKACYDAVNKLEKVQMKFKIHGDESTDSDSDGELSKEAISNIELSKSSISKTEPLNNLVSKIEPSIGIELYAKDDTVSQNIETIRERAKGNTTLNCNICKRKYFPFSYGRDLIKEDRNDVPLECLICQRLFIPRPSKRRKPVTDGKPFGCMLCRCRFGEKRTFEQHLKYHTSQTPYQCHACEQKFHKRPILLTHLKACKPCFCGIKCFQVLGPE